MHLVSLTALVSLWISIASASLWSMIGLPSGDLQSLREIVRKYDYKAVDPDTLPFKDDSPDPQVRRRKECAKCMWQVLMLVSQGWCYNVVEGTKGNETQLADNPIAANRGAMAPKHAVIPRECPTVDAR